MSLGLVFGSSGPGKPSEAAIDAAIAGLSDPDTKENFKAALLAAALYRPSPAPPEPATVATPDGIATELAGMPMLGTFAYDPSTGAHTTSFDFDDFIPASIDHTYYVSKYVAVSGDGLSAVGAFKTFAEAFAAVSGAISPGDNVIIYESSQQISSYLGSQGLNNLSVPAGVGFFGIINLYPEYVKDLNGTNTTDTSYWTWTATATSEVYYKATSSRPTNLFSTVERAITTDYGAIPDGVFPELPALRERTDITASDIASLAQGDWIHGLGPNGTGVYARAENGRNLNTLGSTIRQGASAHTNILNCTVAPGVDTQMYISGFRMIGGSRVIRMVMSGANSGGVRPKLILRSMSINGGNRVGVTNTIRVEGGIDIYTELCSGVGTGEDWLNLQDHIPGAPTLANSPRLFAYKTVPIDTGNMAANSANLIARHGLATSVTLGCVLPKSKNTLSSGQKAASNATKSWHMSTSFGVSTGGNSSIGGDTDAWIDNCDFEEDSINVDRLYVQRGTAPTNTGTTESYSG